MDLCLLILTLVMAVSGSITLTSLDTTMPTDITTTVLAATDLTTNTTTTVVPPTNLPTNTTTTVVALTNLTTPTTTTVVALTNLTTPTTTTVVALTNLTTPTTTTVVALTNLTTATTTTVVALTNLTTPTTTTVVALTNLPTNTTTTVVALTNLTTPTTTTVVALTNLTTPTTTTVVALTNLSTPTTTTVVALTNLTTPTTTTVVALTNLTTPTTTTVVALTNLSTTTTTTVVAPTNLSTTTNTTVVAPTNLSTTTTTTVVATTNLSTTTTTTVVALTNLTTTTTTTVVAPTNLSTTTTSTVVALTHNTTTTVVPTTNLISTNAITSSMVTNIPLNLLCQNGGKPTNNLCICPDNLTGQLCENENFCNETDMFPKTIIGQVAYSKNVCPSEKINAGFPTKTAWCLSVTHNFSISQTLNCEMTLDKIDTDLLAYSATNTLASSTQILTSKPEKLTSQNISMAAKIVSSLLKNASSPQDIYLASITTVSQLLNANSEQFNNIPPESISSLTRTLQNFSLTQNDSGSQIVQPNIAIQSVMYNSSEIQFTVYSALNTGDANSLSANRIKINNSFNVPNSLPFNVQMNVSLSQGTDKIGFVLYNNDQFFKSQVFKPSLNLKRPVISGHVAKNKALNVNFTMTNQEAPRTIHDFACVIWDYGVNDWSTKGCQKIVDANKHSCKCERSTTFANFAMLMTYRSDPEISQALAMVSLIGCAMSVVGLIITVIFQILTRKSRRSSPTILLVSICVCMLIVYLLFIFGIQNLDSSSNPPEENIIPVSDFYIKPDHGPCTAFAVLLHYFLLATFTWSTLYSAHIFLLIKNTISGPPRYFMTLSVVMGWGLPAVVVGISLGISYRVEDPLNYRQEAVCWLAAVDQQKRFDATKPMLWGFLLPVAVMLFFNIAVLLYFSYTTCRINPDLSSSQVTPLRNKMLGCISMAVVLGVSWMIGYFLLLETNPIMHTILSFAFCLCNTTQGIQIFVLFTLRTAVFKEKALIVLDHVPARHRKTFELWVLKEADPEENYISTFEL
ncbi:adhesion G-protein coupled receptor G7 [Tachysurus fulvidraco]|uniref:adhesion G-protein coupled receptor G7 n=1 Tax=Tachysurus fulvidraco TaxID=1234273 RepID=UPI001FEDE114|nr:adhesion G-protein coupled receptor G7 [Tachysurus fulvidraco]